MTLDELLARWEQYSQSGKLDHGTYFLAGDLAEKLKEAHALLAEGADGGNENCGCVFTKPAKCWTCRTRAFLDPRRDEGPPSPCCALDGKDGQHAPDCHLDSCTHWKGLPCGDCGARDEARRDASIDKVLTKHAGTMSKLARDEARGAPKCEHIQTFGPEGPSFWPANYMVGGKCPNCAAPTEPDDES